MQNLALKIRENLDTLAAEYVSHLDNIQNYRDFSKKAKYDIAQDDLRLIANCLETGDFTDFITFTETKAKERLEANFANYPLLKALTALETTLFPLITNIKTAKSLWSALSEARDAVAILIAQESFYQQREFLWRVIDTTPNFIFVRDAEGKFILANQSLAESYGTNVKDIVGKTDADFNPNPDEVAQIQEDDLAVMTSLKDKVIPEQIITTAGEKRWMQIIKRPLTDEDGVARSILGIATDVTERKQLEHELQTILTRREQQVTTSTEIAQEITAAADLDEIYLRVVTLIKERLGYYHVQIFEHAPEEDAMVVIKGYGEAGEKMLSARHSLPYGRGVVGTAAATREPVLAANTAEDTNWVPHPNLPDTKGELAVPIIWQDEVLGVLDVQHDQANALTQEDQVVLMGLAGQIAIAIKSAQNAKALRDREEIFRVLFDASQDAIMTLAPPTWQFTSANSATLKLFKAESEHEFTLLNPVSISPERQPDGSLSSEQVQKMIAIAMREGSAFFEWTHKKLDGQEFPSTVQMAKMEIRGQELLQVTVRDITERKATEIERDETLHELERLTRAMTHEGWSELRKESKITGYHFDKNTIKPANKWWTPEVSEAVQHGEVVPPLEESQTAVAPLSVRGEIIGALGVQDDPNNPLSQEDLALIENASEEIAQALESARLFEETQIALNESEILYEVSRNLGQMDEEQTMFEFVLPKYLEYLKLTQGGILIVNDDHTTGTLKALVKEGQLTETDFEIPLVNNWPMEKLIETKEAVTITNPHQHENLAVRDLSKKLNYKSLLLAPIIIRDEVVGTLGADATETIREFTEREIALVQAIANQLSIAMANLRSRDEIQSALAEVEATQRLYLREEWEKFVPELETLLYEQTLGEFSSTEITSPTDGKPAVGESSETGLVIPLTLRGETIGVLGLEKPEGEEGWTSEEMTLIESVSEQLTMALESARLLEESQSRAAREQLVGKVTAKMSETLNVDSVIRTAANEIFEVLDLEHVTIRLSEDETASQEEISE